MHSIELSVMIKAPIATPAYPLGLNSSSQSNGCQIIVVFETGNREVNEDIVRRFAEVGDEQGGTAWL